MSSPHPHVSAGLTWGHRVKVTRSTILLTTTRACPTGTHIKYTQVVPDTETGNIKETDRPKHDPRSFDQGS